MIDYNPLYKQLENTPLHNWINELPKIIKWNLRTERYAHIPEWEAILDKLPELNPSEIDLIESVTAYGQKTSNLRDLLMQLHPWRKGPYHLYDIHIDTEWRSDWKWNRLIPHIKPLKKSFSFRYWLRKWISYMEDGWVRCQTCNWNRSPTLIYMPVFCGQTFTKYICSRMGITIKT